MLTDQQKKQILERWQAGETQAQLAAALGVSQAVISVVCRSLLGLPRARQGEARLHVHRSGERRKSPVPFTAPDNPPRLVQPDELWSGEAEKFENATKRVGAHLLWQMSLDDHGYGQFTVNGAPVKAHRVAWRLAYGRETLKGLFALHRCDTPACVEPTHLFAGTQADNMRDMQTKKRGRRADPTWTSPTLRITWEQVCEMRRLREKENWIVVDLAKHFNCSKAQVSNIVSYRQRKNA